MTAKALVAIATLTGLVWVTATGPAAAQQTSVPDFTSNFAGWVANTEDYEAVEGSPGTVTGDPAHPYYSNATARRLGVSSNYRVADLTNPNVKPWANEIMKRENEKVLGGGIGFTARSSCMPAGVPAFAAFAAVQPIYFVQTPKQVTMIFEGDAQVRRVYMDVPHSADPKPSWYGESVGHYEEGDTLVIDTIGLNNKTFLNNYRTPHTEKLHVVERWKLLGSNTLELLFTVDDPDTFFKPWTAAFRFHRVQRSALPYEEVCAENNFQFEYHVPVAQKPDF
jgi:hypothetical protein